MGGERGASYDSTSDPWAATSADPWASTAAPRQSHEQGGRHEEESEGKVPDAVDYPLKVADWAHVAGDAAMDGGVHFGEISHDLAHHAGSIFTGEASAAQKALGGFTAVAAPLAIVGGMVDAYDAYEELKAGDMRGAATGLQAGATITGGVSGIGGLAGIGEMAATSSLALSAATGLQLGRYGDKQIEKLGWFQDREGDNVGASGWIADRAQRADDSVADAVGHGLLGRAAGGLAGLGTWAGMSAISPWVAAAGAGAGMGRGLAHSERVGNYAGKQWWQPKDRWEGIQQVGRVDPRTGKTVIADRGTDGAREWAQEQADWDDRQEEAIARSKREHPERWATPEPKTQRYGQWIDQTLFRMQAASATYRK